MGSTVRRAVLFLMFLATTALSQTPPPAPANDARAAHERDPFFYQWPPAQQQQFLKLLDDWSKLAPARRQGLLDQFEKARNLTPEQRDSLKRRLQRFEQFSPEERTEMLERMHKWQQMTPEQQAQLRKKHEEFRAKAETDMNQRLQTLGVKPSASEMAWIRRFYFHKLHEVNTQVGERKHQLEAQLPAGATDDQKAGVATQVQQYRAELETKAMEEFDAFARKPHPLLPPGHPGAGTTNSHSANAPQAPPSKP